MTIPYTSKKLRRACILLVLVSILLLLLYHSQTVLSRARTTGAWKSHRQLAKHNTSSAKFLVDTPTCRIPYVDPYDPTIRGIVSRTGKRSCPRHIGLTYQAGNQLKINWTLANSHEGDGIKHCTYTPLHRPNYTPTNNNYLRYREESQPFTNYANITDEFVKASCYDNKEKLVYTNFHAFIQRNTSRDELLMKRLIKHVARDKISEPLNVIMLGMDSVSRLSFIRQMVKTKDFLDNTLGAYDMSGYNKVADNTFINIVPMTLGKFVAEMPWDESKADQSFDDFKFIWNRYSDSGYRTFYAEDAPDIAIFDFLKSGFKTPPTDHFNRPISIAMELNEHLWSGNHHCFQDRLETEIVLKYMYDFVDTYRSDPYFAFSFITRLSHDDVNSAGAADEPYYNFFKSLHDNDLLSNTVVLFYSDHGMRFGQIRETFIGKLEERLPFMYAVIPKWLRERHPFLHKNLQTNQHRLSTPFDVYETLLDILHFDGQEQAADKSRGVSWFREVPHERSCDQAGILPHWCTCLQHKPLGVQDNVVVKASETLMIEITRQLLDYTNICEVLSLHNIREAGRLVEPDAVLRFVKNKEAGRVDNEEKSAVFGDNTKTVEDIQVVIETVPGNAVFEATVRLNTVTSSYIVIGDISRINIYGHQSDCIEVFKLKKYCQCKENTILT